MAGGAAPRRASLTRARARSRNAAALKDEVDNLTAILARRRAQVDDVKAEVAKLPGFGGKEALWP